MLISDITITYNNIEGLKRTLDSFLQQTFLDFEVIVIDGGSTDQSAELLERYVPCFAEKGIAYSYVSEPDGGRYNAMNKGVGKASGEWVMFMNAGDTLSDSHTLEAVSEHLIDSEVDIVYGDNQCVYGDIVTYHKAEGSVEYIKRGLPFSHQSVMTKLKLFKQRGYDEQFKISGDYDWFLGAYLESRVFRYVNICISDFYMDGISSNQRFAGYKESLKVRKKYDVQDFILIRWIKTFVWFLIDKFNIDNKKIVDLNHKMEKR